MLWMTAVNYDKQHRIKIWLNRRKKMHERTNEWMNIGTHLSIKSAIFNIGQKGEKFSNLQNENGPLNRYGIKKERARERETWSKSDEFVRDFKMGMAMALGKYFSHYPTFQQNNFKRTSIQIFTHRMLWKLKEKGSKKVNVLYIHKFELVLYWKKYTYTQTHTRAHIPVSHGSCVLWTSFEMVKWMMLPGPPRVLHHLLLLLRHFKMHISKCCVCWRWRRKRRRWWRWWRDSFCNATRFALVLDHCV